LVYSNITMLITTVTQKGQATIPLSLRESLGLFPGTKVQFLEGDGEVKLRPLPTLQSFMGALKGKKLPTGKDFEKIFAEEAIDRYQKTLKK